MTTWDFDLKTAQRNLKQMRHVPVGAISPTHPRHPNRIYRDVILENSDELIETLQELIELRLQAERAHAYDVLDGARPSVWRVRKVQQTHAAALSEINSFVAKRVGATDPQTLTRFATAMVEDDVAHERAHIVALARLSGYSETSVQRLLAFQLRVADSCATRGAALSATRAR